MTDSTSPGHRAARDMAIVAGLFSLAVMALLLQNFLAGKRADFLDSKALVTLKDALKENPTDEALKERIRAMDLALREDYFTRQERSNRYAWALFAGAIAFLAALKISANRRQKLPSPVARPADAAAAAEARAAKQARWSVAAAGLAVAALAVLLAANANPGPALTPEALKREAPSYPSDEEIAREWPRFRGPRGDGVSAFAGIPISWDGTTGAGIVWKTALPLPGKSSPVVWGDRVFLTSATEKERAVYCIDAAKGAILWTGSMQGIEGSPPKPPEIMEETGFASSTAATDGRRVYAIFANGDIAAFDYAGKRVWARNLGSPENIYGHAASLLLFRNLVIVPYDQAGEEDGKSRLLALNAATGREVWAATRPVPNSWTTPILIRAADRDQIVTAAAPWVIAYEAATGREIWRASCLDGDVAPSPIFAGGLVFAVNTGAKLAAIRPDGQGDVTKTHVAWMAEDGLPDIVSPVGNDEVVLLCQTDGFMTCYAVKDGGKRWELELGEMVQASPSLVGNRLYVVHWKGVTVIHELSREGLTEVAKCPLGEKVFASPAFVEGTIYLRGEKHLFCIGKGTR